MDILQSYGQLMLVVLLELDGGRRRQGRQGRRRVHPAAVQVIDGGRSKDRRFKVVQQRQPALLWPDPLPTSLSRSTDSGLPCPRCRALVDCKSLK